MENRNFFAHLPGTSMGRVTMLLYNPPSSSSSDHLQSVTHRVVNRFPNNSQRKETQKESLNKNAVLCLDLWTDCVHVVGVKRSSGTGKNKNNIHRASSVRQILTWAIIIYSIDPMASLFPLTKDARYFTFSFRLLFWPPFKYKKSLLLPLLEWITDQPLIGSRCTFTWPGIIKLFKPTRCWNIFICADRKSRGRRQQNDWLQEESCYRGFRLQSEDHLPDSSS